jgi:hypothetical protein
MDRQQNTRDARTPEQGVRTLSQHEVDEVAGGRKAGRPQQEFLPLTLLQF